MEEDYQKIYQLLKMVSTGGEGLSVTVSMSETTSNCSRNFKNHHRCFKLILLSLHNIHYKKRSRNLSFICSENICGQFIFKVDFFKNTVKPAMSTVSRRAKMSRCIDLGVRVMSMTFYQQTLGTCAMQHYSTAALADILYINICYISSIYIFLTITFRSIFMVIAIAMEWWCFSDIYDVNCNVRYCASQIFVLLIFFLQLFHSVSTGWVSQVCQWQINNCIGTISRSGGRISCRERGIISVHHGRESSLSVNGS